MASKSWFLTIPSFLTSDIYFYVQCRILVTCHYICLFPASWWRPEMSYMNKILSRNLASGLLKSGSHSSELISSKCPSIAISNFHASGEYLGVILAFQISQEWQTSVGIVIIRYLTMMLIFVFLLVSWICMHSSSDRSGCQECQVRMHRLLWVTVSEHELFSLEEVVGFTTRRQRSKQRSNQYCVHLNDLGR